MSSIPVQKAQWETVRRLFDQALDLPESARESFLRSQVDSSTWHVEKVIELLGAYEPASDHFDDLALRMSQLMAAGPEGQSAGNNLNGSQIGEWEIERVLGHGGMGAVYLARRTKGGFEQECALKIISRETTSAGGIESLERERRTLARLDHQNITRIVDGGVTEDGRPYFVMDLVDGTSLTDYCDANKKGIKERVALFLQVCSAVGYAHRNLILHCDLKPGNVLIDREARVQLLDFGIARRLDASDGTSMTQARRLQAMTPKYASPEQKAGKELTTQSDVYSLGMLLGELLAGLAPPQLTEVASANHALMKRSDGKDAPASLQFRNSNDLRQIAESRGTTVNGLRKQLSGDLTAIVFRAVQPAVENRYESVDELASDLTCFLNGLPVGARGGAPMYRFGKLIKRNPLPSLITSVLLISTIGGALAATKFGFEAREQAAVSELEREKAQQVATFLQSLFALNEPDSTRGEAITARELLDRGAERLEGELKNQPRVLARLQGVVGDVYEKLGVADRAEQFLRASLANPSADESSLEFVRVKVSLARVLAETEDGQEAISLLEEAIQVQSSLLGNNHPEVADTLGEFANVFMATREFARAEEMGRQAIAILDGYKQVDSAILGTNLSNLATALTMQDKFREAAPIYERADQLLSEAMGEDSPSVLSLRSMHANVLNEVGRSDEALELLISVLADKRRVLGDRHPSLAYTLNNLGKLAETDERFEAAADYFTEALGILRETYGANHAGVPVLLSNLVGALHGLGQFDQSAEMLEEALSALSADVGDMGFAVADYHVNLAEAYWGQGRNADARVHIDIGISQYKTLVEPDSRFMSEAYEIDAKISAQATDYVAAENRWLRVMEIEEKRWGTQSARLENTVVKVAEFYESWGRQQTADEFRGRAQALQD